MATTTIFDCQYDTTNYSNSFVIGRASTNNDIHTLVAAKDLELEDKISVDLNGDDDELSNLINEFNLTDVIVNDEGKPTILSVQQPKIWAPLLTDLSQLGTDSITFTNHNTTFTTEEKFSSCCYFNGSQQWIQWSGNLGNFYNNDWTIACWLRPTDNTRSVIISEYSGTGASNVAIELSVARVIRLYWDGSPDIYFSSAGSLVLNEWTHMALTKSGRVIKLYFNGELVQTYTNSSDFSTKTSACQPRIGDDYRGNSSNDVSYQGYMTDFRMYQSCLTDAQIRQLVQEIGVR